MKTLPNPTHERFARLLIQGLTQKEAYRKCYPNMKPESINSNAYKLANSLEVKARIAEMRELIDSQFAMEAGRRRDLARRMAEGEIPTKVVRKADGKVEAIFDRLAAMQLDAKLAGDFAPEQLQVSQGPTLKLEWKMVGRNTALSPAMEAEWQELVAESKEPEVKALPEPPPEQEDLSRYAEIEIPRDAVSLDSLKVLIDEEEQPTNTTNESNLIV
jgi:hypothetical protein